ncbi:P-loop containing nucleoside triphosphate hydrolase protein [Penicillium verhagenii]|nr:P-loop containing nucleoside triphosphate hydrolase protein [Penicillium verhagenii]
MGLLASNEVIKASASELVAQYIGHTGPKTQKLLERGLGKVLFIDEAYRLAEGLFAKEAMDELVDCITKPKFARKLIIILAGYDADINRLMSINPGLTSRFPESIQFESLSPRDCINLLNELLERNKEGVLSKSKVNFDISCLYRSDSDLNQHLTHGFGILSKTASWANARDVETLVKAIFGKTIKSLGSITGSKLVLSRDTVVDELQDMIDERQSRENTQPTRSAMSFNPGEILPMRTQSLNPPARNMTNQSQNQKYDDKVNAPVQDNSDQQSLVTGRDAGVTDEEWNQLQKDKADAEQREKDYRRMVEEEEAKQKELLRLKEEEEKAARAAEEARQKQDEELRKRLEQERLRLELERRRQEDIARKLEIQRKALEEARRKEQAIQTRLRSMGVCVQDFQWIKRSSGYQWAGGSHWVSDAQLQ